MLTERTYKDQGRASVVPKTLSVTYKSCQFLPVALPEVLLVVLLQVIRMQRVVVRL